MDTPCWPKVSSIPQNEVQRPGYKAKGRLHGGEEPCCCFSTVLHDMFKDRVELANAQSLTQVLSCMLRDI